MAVRQQPWEASRAPVPLASNPTPRIGGQPVSAVPARLLSSGAPPIISGVSSSNGAPPTASPVATRPVAGRQAPPLQSSPLVGARMQPVPLQPSLPQSFASVPQTPEAPQGPGNPFTADDITQLVMLAVQQNSVDNAQFIDQMLQDEREARGAELARIGQECMQLIQEEREVDAHQTNARMARLEEAFTSRLDEPGKIAYQGDRARIDNLHGLVAGMKSDLDVTAESVQRVASQVEAQELKLERFMSEGSFPALHEDIESVRAIMQRFASDNEATSKRLDRVASDAVHQAHAAETRLLRLEQDLAALRMVGGLSAGAPLAEGAEGGGGALAVAQVQVQVTDIQRRIDAEAAKVSCGLELQREAIDQALCTLRADLGLEPKTAFSETTRSTNPFAIGGEVGDDATERPPAAEGEAASGCSLS